MSSERLIRTFSAIDRANRADPNVEQVKGENLPKELLYGERMSGWLIKLCPNADEAHQIAARAQHIMRWQIPRSNYPQTKEGYLRWRTALYRFHGEQAASILAEEGYDEAMIERVRRMISKQGIKRDPDVQLIEDVACLVFLEYYFPAFVGEHGQDKVVDIVRKTWRKMSDSAHTAALTIVYPDHLRPILAAALNPESAE